MELTKIRELISDNENDGEKGLELKPVVKCLTSFVTGLVMMNPFVIGQLSPFSLSLVCALRDACALWAGAGGIIGSFLFFDGTQAVKYIASILMCVFIKGICAKLLPPRHRSVAQYVNSGVTPLLIGTAISLATGFNADELAAVLYESVLACAGTFVFRTASDIVWSSKKISRLTTFETAVTLLSAGIVLMHLYKYKIFEFSPVVLIFCALILLFARVKSSAGGALCGICLAFSAGLSGELGFVCLGLAAGGFLCGELIRNSRHAGALGFIIPVCLCAIADRSLGAYLTVIEGVTAASLFLIIPEKAFTFISEKVNAPVPVTVRSDDSRMLARKLNNASEAILRVSDCVNTVRRTLKPEAQTKLNHAVKSAWYKVCRECELRGSCRPEVKTPTDEAVERLAAALQNSADPDETKFPKGFSVSCYRFAEMQAEMKSRYLDFTAECGAQGQLEQIRGQMSEQFRNMADILRGFACELDDEINTNAEAADTCANEAREFGLDVISAVSHLDSFGRVSVSLNISAPDRNFNVSRLTENLSNAVGTALDLPELTENGSFCTLKFGQKIAYSVSVGAFSRPADNENVCGDYYRSFRDANGRYLVILCDGMGTGSRAAIDSAMAAEMFSRLIKAGLSFDSALSITNSALQVKSEEESLSTLDVLCIDLYTGVTNFLKAGAAATFIRRRDSVVTLEQASLPLGILCEAEFAKENAALESGDVILMVSDGVSGDSCGWIQQELKLWSTENSPQKLAEYIVENARERRLAKHRDDMTAVAVYIN